MPVEIDRHACRGEKKVRHKQPRPARCTEMPTRALWRPASAEWSAVSRGPLREYGRRGTCQHLYFILHDCVLYRMIVSCVCQYYYPQLDYMVENDSNTFTLASTWSKMNLIGKRHVKLSQYKYVSYAGRAQTITGSMVDTH